MANARNTEGNARTITKGIQIDMCQMIGSTEGNARAAERLYHKRYSDQYVPNARNTEGNARAAERFHRIRYPETLINSYTEIHIPYYA